jgi:hypothetical protein
MKQHLSPLLSIAVLGCAAPANPPSLLPRAIETRPETSPTVSQPSAAQPISASLATKLTSLVAEANAGDVAFAKAIQMGSAAIIAGRSSAPGSEPWVAAELVRSALQVARQRSAAALAEIDSLAVTQSELAVRDPSVGGLNEILAAQTEVDAIVARQTARLDALNR